MKNEKGMTLIELLAALTISLIILTLVFSVLHQVFNYYNKTQAKLRLSQEANLILARLEQHHKQNVQYKLRYENNQLFIGVDTADGPLSEQGFSIMNLKLQNADIHQSSTSIELNRNDNPLFIEFTILDPKSNQQLDVRTMINRYEG